MSESEDDFVRHTRQQWKDLRLGPFDEKRCREIYRRIQPMAIQEPQERQEFQTIAQQMEFFL